MRTLLACLSMILLSPAIVEAQTPFANPTGFAVTQVDDAYQVVWDESAEILDDGSGTGPIWQPISLRLIVTDDMNLNVELRNTSEDGAVTPILNLTVFSEGQSLAVESVAAENEYVEPGGSAFYQGLLVFGGSLLPGDWDEFTITLEPNTWNEPNALAHESVEIDGERITNSGDVPIGEISTLIVVRDAEGIYLGSCFGPYTGANILPGKSVRAPGLGDEAYHPLCGFNMAGEEASESLGIGSPFTVEYVIARISEPV